MSLNTFQTPHPTCPHCGHEMSYDDMASVNTTDLYALAPNEDTAEIECPICDKEYVVQGGYRPHYTSAFSHEELS